MATSLRRLFSANHQPLFVLRSTSTHSADRVMMLRAQRCVRASPVHLRRLQHSTSTASTASVSSSSSVDSACAKPSSGSNNRGEEPPKYKPGWFSRNPGVTLGGFLLGIGFYIYRGSRGKKNFEAVQNPIVEAAVISPYEAWELRSSNNITPEVFEDVRDGATRVFPAGKATMRHFDQYLGFKLAPVCPTGVNKAYHLERVLLSLKTDTDRKSDVDAQLVAFSMAVKGAVDERLRILFNLAANAPMGEALATSSEDDEARDDKTEEETADAREVSQDQLKRLLQLLLETHQIPSEKRVLAVEDAKYPFQEYTAATPSDLLKAAVRAQVSDKTITEEQARDRRSYTFEAFAQLMRGKTVCLWGECFASSKKKMKN